MPKATIKQLKGWIKEERATAKLYHKLGYYPQARQEASHAKYFKQQLKKR